jgi:hypothetical protein
MPDWGRQGWRDPRPNRSTASRALDAASGSHLLQWALGLQLQ